MRAAITGATGLLGSNLALLLLRQGIAVRCTYRGSLRGNGHLEGHLEGHSIEWVRAELSDPEALSRAFADCDVVFHCAAAISFRRHPTPATVTANVDGTRNILVAVRAARVPRLVHVSSVVTCAISTDGTPVDETRPWNFADFGLDEAYSVTKRQGEQLVLEEAARGLPAVVVNPGYLLGPLDPKPGLVVSVARGKVPSTTPGMNSFVDVRDVCRGLIGAWQKGRIGERYILAGHNLTYAHVMRLIAKLAGTRPPPLALPEALATPVGWLGELKQLLTGKDALINSVTVRYSYLRGYVFSSEKARRELGYEWGPLEPAIADAIAWARQNGQL